MFFVPSCVFGQINYSEVNLSVDFSGNTIPYKNYWHSTGFTPGDLLLRKGMQQTLDYLSAVPNEGIKYIRPHWMLNLIGSRNAGTKKAEYNFEKLDSTFDELVSRGLKPIFEIMGFPNLEWNVPKNKYDKYAQGQENEVKQWVPNFNEKKDYQLWYKFVKEMVSHLEQRYSSEELKEWYFECTNEPDITDHFWMQGIPALTNYWDASSEAIKAVNPEYRTGGPGNARGVNETFKGFLAHCDNGKNVITGKKGAPLDFISVHRKARPYLQIGIESESINYIRENHPRFAKLPFWNDEADPIGGWGIPYWWRADAWYGTCIVSSVDAHNRLSIDKQGVNIEILSNDNGFMGNWFQRTHLAGFTDSADKNKFWLFKQADLSVMTLLGLSIGERFEVEGYNSENETTVLIPSKTKNGNIILLIANKPEFGELNALKTQQEHVLPGQYETIASQGSIVHIDLKNIDLSGFTSTLVRLDDVHGNPFTVWTASGQPYLITADEYRMIAANQEPVVIEKTTAKNQIRLVMPPSSVGMVILSKEKKKPEAPEIIGVHEYQGFNGEKTEFVRWKQIPTQVVTYDVFASYDGGEFVKINPQPLFDCGFLNTLPENVNKVKYRVVANSLN